MNEYHCIVVGEEECRVVYATSIEEAQIKLEEEGCEVITCALETENIELLCKCGSGSFCPIHNDPA